MRVDVKRWPVRDVWKKVLGMLRQTDGPMRRQTDKMIDRWHAPHHTETRPGSVEKEDCTMLFVDGGFSIDIILDLSL